MKFLKSLTKYFTGLGVGFFGVSLYAFTSAWQERVNAEDYQWPYLKEGNEAKMIAGVIVLILSSIMFVLAFISLITYRKVKKNKEVKRELEPVRQKSCPSCGTDISFLAICPKCGYVVKTK